ncbi:PAS domain-containing protein [Bradyrhizobium liaoningense]
MQQFVCEQNIVHFERLLNETSDPTVQSTVRALLASAKRQLALLNSAASGADTTPFEQRRRQHVDPATIRRQFQPEFDSSPHPYMLLDPGPGLSIVDINDAYAAATFISRADVVGRSLFEIFPDNPDDPLADGVSNLYGSLRIVGETGQAHAMAIQRYDIRDPDGSFVERHWQPINSPIHDTAGHLVFLLHHVEDVTAQVMARR